MTKTFRRSKIYSKRLQAIFINITQFKQLISEKKNKKFYKNLFYIVKNQVLKYKIVASN